MAITSANRLELLQIAEAVAREKLIDPNLVIEAMEDSLGKAAKSRYGAEYDIRAAIDRKTGELSMARCRTVVEDEEYENTFTELTLEEAREKLEELLQEEGESMSFIKFFIKDSLFKYFLM